MSKQPYNPFEIIDSRLSNIEELLLSIKHRDNGSSIIKDPKKPLSVNDAATFTNLKVPTIYNLVNKNLIPYFKRPGSKRLYFLEEDLRKWMLETRHKTISEIESDAVMLVDAKIKKG